MGLADDIILKNLQNCFHTLLPMGIDRNMCYISPQNVYRISAFTVHICELILNQMHMGSGSDTHLWGLDPPLVLATSN